MFGGDLCIRLIIDNCIVMVEKLSRNVPTKRLEIPYHVAVSSSCLKITVRENDANVAVSDPLPRHRNDDRFVCSIPFSQERQRRRLLSHPPRIDSFPHSLLPFVRYTVIAIYPRAVNTSIYCSSFSSLNASLRGHYFDIIRHDYLFGSGISIGLARRYT